GGSEKFGRAIPGCLTVIAEPVGPQENMMVPGEPGATWVMFAVRVVDPVPQLPQESGDLDALIPMQKQRGLRLGPTALTLPRSSVLAAYRHLACLVSTSFSQYGNLLP